MTKYPRENGLSSAGMGPLEAFADYKFRNWECLFCGGDNESRSSVLCSGCNGWYFQNVQNKNVKSRQYLCWKYVEASNPSNTGGVFFARFSIAGDLFLEVFGDNNE